MHDTRELDRDPSALTLAYLVAQGAMKPYLVILWAYRVSKEDKAIFCKI